MRKATDVEKRVFQFLNELRESGVTNMFGAASFIREEFEDIGEIESRQLLCCWMSNFNDEGDYEMIKDE